MLAPAHAMTSPRVTSDETVTMSAVGAGMFRPSVRYMVRRMIARAIYPAIPPAACIMLAGIGSTIAVIIH